jgi:hypothetical protein
MESADEHACGLCAQERFYPLSHLPRSPVRKGHGNDMFRRHALFDQIRNAPDNGERFPRARPCHNQQVTVGFHDRLFLRVVQTVK